MQKLSKKEAMKILNNITKFYLGKGVEKLPDSTIIAFKQSISILINEF